MNDPSNYNHKTRYWSTFNRILNNRLTPFLEKVCEELTGFKRGRRTPDHMFVINTLVQKYIRNTSQPLYMYKRMLCILKNGI